MDKEKETEKSLFKKYEYFKVILLKQLSCSGEKPDKISNTEFALQSSMVFNAVFKNHKFSDLEETLACYYMFCCQFQRETAQEFRALRDKQNLIETENKHHIFNQ